MALLAEFHELHMRLKLLRECVKDSDSLLDELAKQLRARVPKPEPPELDDDNVARSVIAIEKQVILHNRRIKTLVRYLEG